MNTLVKTIKRKWFNMIVSGEKKHEYLEIKKYWIQRLLIDVEVKNNADILSYGSLIRHIIAGSDDISYSFNEFDQVKCRNGYNPNSPVVLWDHLKITIGEGKEEWGAVPGVKYFILHIGDIKRVELFLKEHNLKP